MVASLLRSRIFARSSVPLERQDILGQGKGKPPLWESHLLGALTILVILSLKLRTGVPGFPTFGSFKTEFVFEP
nr:hypothetical protein Iba_chr06eCG7850 [Ipomoea batatas]GMD11889.1 hypothetical protein Iba_chr06fCG7970 [Ipomoea batatas]